MIRRGNTRRRQAHRRAGDHRAQQQPEHRGVAAEGGRLGDWHDAVGEELLTRSGRAMHRRAYNEAVVTVNRASAMLDPRRTARAIDVFGIRGAALLHLGAVQESKVAMERCLELARFHDSPMGELRALNMLTAWHLDCGILEQVAPLVDAAE